MTQLSTIALIFLIVAACSADEAVARGSMQQNAQQTKPGDGACVQYKIQFCGSRLESLACLKPYLARLPAGCAAAVKRVTGG
jgi:hypothetical protein